MGDSMDDSYFDAEYDDQYMPQSYLDSMRSPTKVVRSNPIPRQNENQDSLQVIVLTELDVMLRDEVKDQSVADTLTELKPLIDHYKCAKRALAAVKALKYREKTSKSTNILFNLQEGLIRKKKSSSSVVIKKSQID